MNTTPRGLPVILAALLAQGCATSPPPPVAVEGDPASVRELEGEWTGRIVSDEGERQGLLVLRIESAARTVRGDVLFIPDSGTVSSAVPGEAHPDPSEAGEPRIRVIDLMRCSAGGVSIVLSPYRDTACDCWVVTRLQGQIQGDTIEGRFSTWLDGRIEGVSGTWIATRTR